MRNAILVLITVSLAAVLSCSIKDKKEQAIVEFLANYRSVKSKEQIRTGNLYTDKIKKMWTPDFSAFDNNSDKSYLIIGNDFKVREIEYLGIKTYDTMNNLKGDSFFVDIDEQVNAEYISGKLIDQTKKTYSVTYWIIITKNGPKVQGDPMMSDFSILESDKSKLNFIVNE